MTDARAVDARTANALRMAATEIRDLRARLAIAEARHPDEPIAVVGMACRFPGCDSPDELWDLLAAGRDAVTALPVDRWDGAVADGFAGVVDDVEGFDAGFFGIAEPEARLMDPQQRMVLECAWHALERAGITAARARAGRTGVFVGVAHQDYLFTALAHGVPPSPYLGLGAARSIIANRVSYQLGLTGPSMAVDTACSSSLAALHLACQSLRSGECDIALAGGVNLIAAPVSTTLTGATLPLSPCGAVRALDARADGMVRSEGAGIVALRRLRDAAAGHDPVLAVVLATACNSDGASNGLTAPNPTAQRRLVGTALAAAGLAPADVGYVELHATGTPLGDPIEYSAVAQAYGAPPATSDTCWLGSVKANLGHLESAAGIASLIKAVECVRRGQVPPQPHLTELNPHIDLAGTRFAVAERLRPWVTSGRRIAGVSSFGFGGTNVHAIVAAPQPVPEPAHPDPGGVAVLPLSARSPAALVAMADAYAALLTTGTDAVTVAGAAARCRDGYPYRLAVTGRTADELVAGLRAARPTRVTEGGTLVFDFGDGGTARWPDPAAGFGPVAAEAAGRERRLWEAALRDRGLTADPVAHAVARCAQRAAGWRGLGIVANGARGTGAGALAADHLLGRRSLAETVELLAAHAPVPPVDAAGTLSIDVLREAGADEVAAVLARCWAQGRDPDWAAVCPGPPRHVPLPVYPWQRKRFWVTDEPSAAGVTPPDLLTALVAGVAELLEIDDPATVDVDQPARDLALESIAFVALKTRIEQEFGVTVPLTDLVDGASLAVIAKRLGESAGARPW